MQGPSVPPRTRVARPSRVLAATSLATLIALNGCAGHRGSSGAFDRNSARIVGDLNSCSPSQTVAMTIKSVDGSSTVSGVASHIEGATDPCTFPSHIDVPPGYHTIGVAYTAGDGVMFGSFSLTAEAGKIYDISVHASGTSYWFDARPRIE